MEDVQSRRDTRGIALDRAGVSGLRVPLVVLDRDNERQSTVASVEMSVHVPEEFKGTHMSRFVEVLEQHRGQITMRTLPLLLADLRERLGSDAARIEFEFPYFLERTAPASGAKALMDYQCRFVGESTSAGDDFVLSVKVPVTSLCPCSKEISDYGAHNQRGIVSVDVRSTVLDGERQFIWIEELISIAESCASAPVYPLLKREDERFVTMQAYDNPAFVEDMVRDVAVALRDDRRVAWFQVHVENFESIHNHSAFASVAWSRDVSEQRIAAE
ncbi:MAG: GTP cyclohydrolase FolE2 [Polyangiaceae bacterium]